MPPLDANDAAHAAAGDASLKARYDRDGFIAPVDVLTPAEAREHRKILEDAEAQIGPLHYQHKIHTVLRSPLQLGTHPKVLDTVEQIIGPDIMLYNVEYIIKEPHSPDFVSWHQDLTYWGLSHDEGQVSMWLALSPATGLSGCMTMAPGTHKLGRLAQDVTDNPNNILLSGQTLRDFDAGDAKTGAHTVKCALAPGQASFHHGWTAHCSAPNASDDRRIGVNVQYVAPYVRQEKTPGYTAMLVRGEDRYGHYAPEIPAKADLDPVALARRGRLQEKHLATSGTPTF
ncbi:MAG: phytanoyl-CoA dioxygenase family protein [Rhodospirillales bacterium]